MNSQFSPNNPEPERFALESLTSRSGAFLQRMEIGLRSSDRRIYQQVASDLISSREAFSLIAPRAIELLADPHPNVCMRAADLILARPHWIGSRALNDFLIPSLCREIANPEGQMPIGDLLFGLTPSASQVSDEHVRRYFGMAQASLIGSSAMSRNLATLSLFGERIPEGSFQRVLSSLAEVVDSMGQVMAIGSQADDLPLERADTCGATATGLLLLRQQIREQIDRDSEECNLETFLVRLMERYISDFATRVEQGDLPRRYEQYHLLLTYPLIVEQNKDITTEQNLNLILRKMTESYPKVAELLYRVRDPHLKVPSLEPLIEGAATPSAESGLTLMTSLMLVMRRFQNRLTDSAVSKSEAVQTLHDLEQLQERSVQPMMFPLFSECARAVEAHAGR